MLGSLIGRLQVPLLGTKFGTQNGNMEEVFLGNISKVPFARVPKLVLILGTWNYAKELPPGPQGGTIFRAGIRAPRAGLTI